MIRLVKGEDGRIKMRYKYQVECDQCDEYVLCELLMDGKDWAKKHNKKYTNHTKFSVIKGVDKE